ncbi:universal stress protein [Oleiagrimonas sp. C23AA]|uniref:universal stress protein n=1 Tax=Oleiagrimonas sp. C23AA TaxID=2719047 RepID=UPI0014219A9B|nr:universal stress protein [Oleiagrimonas sp. C23AA]NII11935.1 universal stress protein [Oleiagrimonas sp. C23AA]
MIKHILVGYDGSDTSRRAVALALDMTAASNGRVRVITVVRVSQGGDDAAVMMTDTDCQTRQRQLREAMDELAGDQAGRIDTQVILGEPGHALLGQVAEYDIDHIVIGHTERGALARWLLGSVSGELLERARVPVTVVR